jgi:arginyl-tRNA synthetase
VTNTEGELLDLEGVAEAFDRTARRLYGHDAPVEVGFEPPRNREFGDYAANVAFKLARATRKAPQAIATEIAERALRDEGALRMTLADVRPVAGFINIRMQPAFWQRLVAKILAEGADYGRAAPTGRRFSLEFGSANPTGPLLVVQGRTLAIGSTLANAMRFVGHDVVTDWIINDAGSQLDALGRSLYARWRQLHDPAFPFPEDGYPGDYVTQLAKDLDALPPDKRDPDDPQFCARFARDRIVEGQRASARRFGVDFFFQSERVFHEAGIVDEIIRLLQEEGLTVRDGDAVALTPELDPDDAKARILRRSDGRPTYFAADIPYHFAKFRHAEHLIDILGPDHHGYIARVRAMGELWRRLYDRPAFKKFLARIDALQLEGPTHWADRDATIDVLIAQQVTLVRGGELVSMSKRAGNILTLDEIADEVGVDAARFFFIMLAPESPLTFDLELAVRQSNENPVYYVQYGHARISSLIAHARSRRETAHFVDEALRGAHLERLVHPAEIALARRLAEWPRVVAQAAKSLAPHLLTTYAREVAGDFHQFYTVCTVVDAADPQTSIARLALSIAARSVLANTLAICGVSAPDFMERRPTAA